MGHRKHRAAHERNGGAEIMSKKKSNNAAVAAIAFALRTEDPMTFLRLWNEGEFDIIRREWDDVPDEVFIGADPLWKKK